MPQQNRDLPNKSLLKGLLFFAHHFIYNDYLTVKIHSKIWAVNVNVTSFHHWYFAFCTFSTFVDMTSWLTLTIDMKLAIVTVKLDL